MTSPHDLPEDDGLRRFLATPISQADLRTALMVIETFKSLENTDEYMMPFIGWARLEQLEDYLRLLTGIDAKKVKDTTAKAYHAQHKV